MTREERDAHADELAARARDGDAAAFDDVCRLLRDDVWRYCYALLGDREQAFDAAQDTFLRVVKGIRTWRGDAPFRVFLLVVARRAVVDLIRAEQRRRATIDPSVDLDRPVAARTGTVDLADLVARLEDDQRDAFVLTQVVGLRYDEAAEVTGVALGTIRSRVHRARARLMAMVEEAESS